MTDLYKYHKVMSTQYFLCYTQGCWVSVETSIDIATLWSIGLFNKVVPYACDKTLILRSVATLGTILVLIIVFSLRPVLVIVTFSSNGLEIR